MRWWEGIGCLARVHKVKAHAAIASAANDHEEWLFKGNREADKWAKKGALRWLVPPQQMAFVQGVEAMARDAIRWHARAQQLFSDGGFCDSQGVVGTSDVSFEISGHEWSHLEELSREEGVVPFEQVPGMRAAPHFAAPVGPC